MNQNILNFCTNKPIYKYENSKSIKTTNKFKIDENKLL